MVVAAGKVANTKMNVVGVTEEFRRIGEVISVQQAFQDAVTPQDPGFQKARADMLKYVTPTVTDKIQDLTVNFDSKRELARVVGMAMGRRQDQTLIDALVAATLPAANIIADGGTNLTYQKVRQVNERFNELAVPMQDRYFGISASGESSILNIEQFTNNFFTNTGVGPGRITMGSLDGSQTMGMNWTIIPTMTEGGLPKAGNIRSLFAWHKWALGLAIGQDMFTEINYIPQNTVWLVNGIHFLGAIVIDPEGVIRVDIDETA